MELNSEAFNKYLFLPHCMKHSTACCADSSEYGYICTSCGQCDISTIIKVAKENNYSVFIVPGGSVIKKIIKEYQIDLKKDKIVGVACLDELSDFRSGMFNSSPNEKIHKAVKLKKSGCINTKVDVDELCHCLKTL